MNKVTFFPGVYDYDFIATNQEVRADHVVTATDKQGQLDTLRSNIREFKKTHDLEKIIVFWNGNTERFSDHITGVHDTAENLIAAIKSNTSEIAPSLLYCVAAILEGCAYVNGSPQNTFCDAALELAKQNNVYLAGDDLKTGQTKFKSVMADFLVSTGLKPVSIVSYNHLGNNDGLNLSSEKQFRSKEITKASVVDDMIASNSILYKDGEHPDHLIVIKYVPTVGDSKRAMDEYTADIFMNGAQTVVVHNTCEDSLLAAPIILDLVLFMELLQRIHVKTEEDQDFQQLDTLTSLLSLFLKAPQVPKHAPVINALFPQKEALVDFLRAAAGLPPTDYIALNYRRTQN
jgi:myo-inositol-1-phosphate synthase